MVLFVRVLFRYLKKHDERMHARAESGLGDCYYRVHNRMRQEPECGFVTMSTTKRLRELVGNTYSKQAAESFLRVLENLAASGLPQPGVAQQPLTATTQERQQPRRRQITNGE